MHGLKRSEVNPTLSATLIFNELRFHWVLGTNNSTNMLVEIQGWSTMFGRSSTRCSVTDSSLQVDGLLSVVTCSLRTPWIVFADALERLGYPRENVGIDSLADTIKQNM